MQLQENEEILVTSNGNDVILTNIRISIQNKNWGSNYMNNIFLEDISSIQTDYRSPVILIVLAFFLALLGIINGMEDSLSIMAFLASIVLVIIWYFSKKRTIGIYPNGGKPILFSANQMQETDVQNFLENLQAAKAKRVDSIYK